MGRLYGGTTAIPNEEQGIGRLSRQGYFPPASQPQNDFFETVKKVAPRIIPSPLG